MNFEDIIVGNSYDHDSCQVQVTRIEGDRVFYRHLTGLLKDDDYDYHSTALAFTELKYRKLDDLCEMGMNAVQGRGYLIGPDGMIYSMKYEACHGMIAAMLYPELAKKYNYGPPSTLSYARDYQQFEIEHGNEIPLVRISIGIFLYSTNISKPAFICIPEQIKGTRRVLMNAMGKKLSDEVETNLRKVTLRKALEWLAGEDQ